MTPAAAPDMTATKNGGSDGEGDGSPGSAGSTVGAEKEAGERVTAAEGEIGAVDYGGGGGGGGGGGAAGGGGGRKYTKQWGRIKLRAHDDDGYQDWWFASTAIPLLAATIAPLANVLSISALVNYWRTDLVYHGQRLTPLAGHDIPDPHWVLGLNIASLVTGYVGNFFLLMNFTSRIRYIIALPVTIFLWYISTATLIAIQVSMNIYYPPQENQVYTQAFWYGVIAAVLYLACSMLLMVNMVGYFLGHYPQHFNLTESQRTLILQSFLFFLWLAGGAGIFSAVEKSYGGTWNFSDALYFCDVTILTVGFGDLTPSNDVGRGLVLPYSVGGIIMLGLMVSSISTFAGEISHDNIMKKRVNKQRVRTLARTTQSTINEPPQWPGSQQSPWQISAPSNPRPSFQGVREQKAEEPTTPLQRAKRTGSKLMRRAGTMRQRARGRRRASLFELQQEKDRFEAMREIQHSTAQFKKWSALTSSVAILLILWLLGAVVFWQTEKDAQGMTYFKAVYFCYVSLLTIGYGDLSPVTNAGRPFFVVWSLFAVPSITILISDMGDTVIGSFKRGTSALADFTVLPKHGIWRDFLNKHPWLLMKLQTRAEKREKDARIRAGIPGPPSADDEPDLEAAPASPNDTVNTPATYRPKTIEELALARGADAPAPSPHDLARRLARAIQRTAREFKEGRRFYTYEEWVDLTELIRFTKDDIPAGGGGGDDDADEGLIEWDWIGEDSPMMAELTEPEFVHARLCESMLRYVRGQARGERREEEEEGGGDGGAGLDEVAEEEHEEEGEGEEVEAAEEKVYVMMREPPRGRQQQRPEDAPGKKNDAEEDDEDGAVDWRQW